MVWNRIKWWKTYNLWTDTNTHTVNWQNSKITKKTANQLWAKICRTSLSFSHYFSVSVHAGRPQVISWSCMCWQLVKRYEWNVCPAATRMRSASTSSFPVIHVQRRSRCAFLRRLEQRCSTSPQSGSSSVDVYRRLAGDQLAATSAWRSTVAELSHNQHHFAHCVEHSSGVTKAMVQPGNWEREKRLLSDFAKGHIVSAGIRNAGWFLHGYDFNLQYNWYS